MTTTPAEHGAPKVLLIDDDDDVRRDYARVLRRLGFVAETAADGQDAIELLQRTSYEVIISDLEMPRMGGLALLRAVRQHDLDVPVVLMTGRPDLSSAMEAVEYGAFRYLTKPVDILQLGELLRRAISMHELATLRRSALELLGVEGRQLGDRASLDARFSNALEELWFAFQPIVRWPDRRVFAYEALLRSDEPLLRSPPEILDAAERLDRLHDLGRRCRERIAAAAGDAPDGALLFVNLHPADLNDDELLSADSPLARFASRVVLEITERSSLHDVRGLAARIARLRQLGYRIAIDDLGSGYAGLSSFSQLEPELVKLDMSLIRDIDTSTKKRSVVRAMSRLCNSELAIQLVCEGVETPGERDALVQEGCSLFQGYLFARAARGFPSPQW
jgi:EAL domain-containing protein (putative c-di-GMP-specific phosphodiesterase class I)